MKQVVLRGNELQRVRAGHPWVFARAVRRTEGNPEAGDVVRLVDDRGGFVGLGFWSPKSAIAARILTRNAEERIDRTFFVRRFEQALEWRRALLGLPDAQTDSYRVVHSEGDGLPGLIVDRYGSTAVAQLLTSGMQRREAELVDVIRDVCGVSRVITKSAVAQAETENDAAAPTGSAQHVEPPLRILERGFVFEIPPSTGQKTGYYFDQRDNRAWVEEHARGRSVLDLYCYAGAFALAAARGGAQHVTSVDSSAAALSVARDAARQYALDSRIEFVQRDVKRVLEEFGDAGRRFDMVIADPPKLIPTVKSLEQGKRAYRVINARALKLVAPGGLLVTCSCSAALKPDDFVELLGRAAADAGRDVRLLRLSYQSADHPILPAFPEGLYLKCAVLGTGSQSSSR